ncbi:MAG: adenine phosphoribosyltransferase [Candidatus Manganitrophus sp.]|nr:adenine phosphoribosyltransferase [Candidatus Manganitrophus sp.]MDC4223239.1 adenine phosphoribosyltransferase [Candidatus Manganitrophus sp.]WDT71657.1 MAG: adenine phosphoribosyltransferase [Candidatus Manganitrophus sp.]WDT76093.1 MAG: adenine phosphoribosyltransferase [Candidatus Manganitrophus sp.]WDT80991.1 MAG: adenine phosphoribosyltransferase [Candidatus Manganitrophus sp.]
MDLKSKIREVPNFPKEGILFYDITTLLKEPVAYQEVLRRLAAPFIGKKIDKVVAIESRGFIFGAPLAERLGAGLIPVRKPGKLPSDKIEEKYKLEYGSDGLAIHRDAISPGERVLIVDDLLATGGTILTTVNLVRQLEGDIEGVAFVIELLGLKGRDKLKGIPITALISYD